MHWLDHDTTALPALSLFYSLDDVLPPPPPPSPPTPDPQQTTFHVGGST